MAARQEISPKGLAWLRGEVAAWQADGLVTDEAAAAILNRYDGGRRTAVVRLISAVGAAFVAAGLISLVAANVDRLSPLVRFAGITAIWLGAVVVAELLHRRHAPADDAAADNDVEPSLLVGSARVIAAAAYGATVFQAAQSLQVPAYTSALLGCWAGGALAYAYAVRGVGPLVVGIGTLVGWYAWALGERAPDGASFVVGLAVAAAAATAVGVAHERGLRSFAAPWSLAAGVLSLVGLFGAALPDVGRDGLDLPGIGYAGIAVAALAVVAAAVRADRQGRRELAAVTAMLAAGLLLAAWAPADTSSELSGAELMHALVGTAVYLATAIWYGVVGAVRDRPQLTNLATAALVIFVTVQSFGVFAPLLSGAALFLLLGVVLIAAGAVADRARRRLVEEVTQ